MSDLPTFGIKPLESIGPIRFGMTRKEVQSELEPITSLSASQEAHVKWDISFPAKDYFFNNAFQVTYTEEQLVEFIEICCVAPNPSFTALYANVSCFETPAYKLRKLIEQDSTVDTKHSEYPNCLTFPSLELSLWEPYNPTGDSEEPEKLRYRTVGLGIPGYYSSKSH